MRAERLSTVASAIGVLREQLNAAEAVRDTLIREMRREGYSAIKLAELAGVARQRAYQILEGPLPLADDDLYASMAERIEDAWQEAVQLWAESDGSGTPEDFFPLELLLDRR